MRLRAMSAAVLCAACGAWAACAPRIDVVAQSNDDAGPDASPTPDASSPDATDEWTPNVPVCDPTSASSIYLVTTKSEIDRFEPATGHFESLGAPDCAPQSLVTVVAAAAATDGTLWLVDASGAVVVVDPRVTPPACSGFPFNIASKDPPPRVAFLPPSVTEAPPLYAINGSDLVVFDSVTTVQAPIGPFDATALVGLSGTFDGRLYALRAGTSSGEASIALIRPGDGTVVSTLTVTLPSASSLSGGAYWSGNFFLFSDAALYTVTLATGELSAPQTLPITDGIVAAASAPCPP
jgi:hypothetical protein